MTTTTQPPMELCPSWCTGESHAASADGVIHFGKVSAGTGFAEVLIEQMDDEPAELFVSSTVNCLRKAQNDGWQLPTDPAVLRGLAADLLAAAEALGRAL